MEKANVTKCPCYGCECRYEACWGSCEKYKAWKNKQNAASHNRWKEEQRNTFSDTHRKQLFRQAKKKK